MSKPKPRFLGDHDPAIDPEWIGYAQQVLDAPPFEQASMLRSLNIEQRRCYESARCHVQEERRKRKSQRRALRFAGVISIPLLGLLYLAILPNLVLHRKITPSQKTVEKITTREDAGAHCMVHVKRRLKSPSTADFQYLGDMLFARDPETEIWSVSGHVDAQNAFGATIRNWFLCRITHEPVKDVSLPIEVTLEDYPAWRKRESRQTSGGI